MFMTQMRLRNVHLGLNYDIIICSPFIKAHAGLRNAPLESGVSGVQALSADSVAPGAISPTGGTRT